MLKVAVGSLNPVKVNAVKSAFAAMLGECEVVGLSVSPGISNMPMSFAEITLGAKNRALAALQAAGADYGVGLEGGLDDTNLGTFLMGFVAIVDKAGKWGYSRGEGLYMPESIVRAVKESGKDLGEVMDDLRGVKNSKQNEGCIGYFTDNLIDREESFKNPTICALSRFKKSELFE
ncbi:MAG TPA: inosine/xanthosine triphosphatase [Candidatus Saccharimonadales bacterium]|nr:inosine/xanthosine triphosphatase [Candidatus Saccharimonadales bacterium]